MRVTLIMLLCWLPILIILYPGTIIFDTWGELEQYAAFISGQGCLTDHHPFFDTLFMGTMIYPLGAATGEWHLIIFAYTMLQAFMTCFAFSYSVEYALKKLDIGANAAFIMFLVYCLLPIYPLSAQTIGKDALSVWIFVLFVVNYIEIIRTDGQSLKDKRFFVGLLVLSVLLCLTKKINIYIVLISLACLVFLKHSKKQALTALLLAVFFSNIVIPSAEITLNVYPGGKQEMFSLPFQMTARYVKDYPEDITEEEYAVIDRVLTMSDLAERYDYLFADPVKGYQQKGSTDDYISYIKVWFAQGIRHPDAYFHAACSMLSGWFSWEKYIPLMDMNWHYDLNPEVIPEWVPYRTFNEDAAKSLNEFYNYLYSVPLFTVLFSYGFYASVLPVFIAATLCKCPKKGAPKLMMCVIPTALSLVLGCWLAPANIQFEGLRYLYPVTFTIPLLLALCRFAIISQKNGEQT